MQTLADIHVRGPVAGRFAEILAPEALAFVAQLHQAFNPTREALLRQRAAQQDRLNAGELPDFLPETRHIRDGDWQVAPPPPDLQHVFMADFEDATAPTWENVISGQINLIDAIERGISFSNASGSVCRRNEKVVTLVIRPRGWHLVEKHVLIGGEPVSASLFDFGLYLFHNAKGLTARGTGPYFYLPKLESHGEARLWNDVFNYAEDALDLRRGTIKATVLVETILAAFEMEEILYELREHAVGLNAGPRDYLFSLIKKFHNHPEFLLPDRSQVGMAVSFMRSYSDLLVGTCHRRGAHALGGRPNQRHRRRADAAVTAGALLCTQIHGGKITETGLRGNISMAIQYLESWLRGTGAVAIDNLVTDAATAEIARSQIWQWLRHGARLADDGPRITPPLIRLLVDEELEQIRLTVGDVAYASGRFETATALFEQVVLGERFCDFLTVPAYAHID